MIVCPHVKDLKITTSNFLPNEVIIKFDIFRSGMEDRVNLVFLFLFRTHPRLINKWASKVGTHSTFGEKGGYLLIRGRGETSAPTAASVG